MKTLKCKDMGMNCDFVASGDSDNDVIEKMITHHEKSHMNEMKKMSESMSTEEIKDKMKAEIK